MHPQLLLRRSEPECHRSLSFRDLGFLHCLLSITFVLRSSYLRRFPTVSRRLKCVAYVSTTPFERALKLLRPFGRSFAIAVRPDSLSPAGSSLLVTLRPQQLSFLSSPHVSHFTCMHPRSDVVLCLHHQSQVEGNSREFVLRIPICH